MSWREPPTNKSAVRRAGKAISDDKATRNDLDIVDQWRASHAYVIKTFRSWLRGHITRQNVKVEFAQRLKRRKTVIDKLQRKNLAGDFLISDVTSMQDFAGCRMIFDNIIDLYAFRQHIHASATNRNVLHKLGDYHFDPP